jgi:hypothetical protein
MAFLFTSKALFLLGRNAIWSVARYQRADVGVGYPEVRFEFLLVLEHLPASRTIDLDLMASI